MYKLRPYQQKSIDLLREKYIEGVRKVVLVIGCGGGKTNIAAEMIKHAAKKNSKVIFLAHRRELITQCRDRLKLFNIDASLILSGHKRDYSNIIQVASIQSLLRQDLPDAAIVFVDECHTSTSKGYQDVINEYHKKGSFIIGLTATPFRTDKKGLGLVYDDFIQPITNTELVEQKAFLPTKVYGAGRISTKKFKTKMGEFDSADVMRAFDVNNVYINLIANYKKYANNLQTIVFCQNVEHSIKTRDCFRENGYNAEHIDADTNDLDRDRIIKEYREGKVQILCNYGILAEGFDVPSTMCVIINCATTSRIKWIQGCGRAQRLFKDKEFGIIIDMADNWARFGSPESDIEVELNPDLKKKKEAGVTPISLCDQCSFIFAANLNQCPECGWKKPIKTPKQIQEEMFVELTKKEQAQIKRQDKDVIDKANIELNKESWARYTKDDWPKLAPELISAYAKFKNYSYGWVYNQRKERRLI